MQNIHGILLMLASTALITIMVIGIRFLSEDLHPLQVAFFRNFFGLFFLLPILLRNGTAQMRTQRLGLLTLRGLLNGSSLMLFFMAVTLIPIAKLAALGFMTPLFVTILAVLFLGEKMGRVRALGLGVGMAGAVLILQPGLEVVSVGAIYQIASVLFWAGAIITTKMLGRTEAATTISFYGIIIMIPITFIPALFVWSWPTPQEYIGMAILGGIWVSAQLCMTQSLKLADASLVIPVDFAKLVWGAAAGFFIFAEEPSLGTWIGGALVMAATTYVAVHERNGRSS